MSLSRAKESPMSKFSTVGVDLAKNVIQVHGIDANGKVMVRRQLRRSRFLAFFEGHASCLIGLEAGSGAHHWGRPTVIISDMTVLLCGSLQTHLGTLMPSGGGHIIKPAYLGRPSDRPAIRANLPAAGSYTGAKGAAWRDRAVCRSGGVP